MAAGADTIKRVFLELGGKSATIVLDDVDDMAGRRRHACFRSAPTAARAAPPPPACSLPRSRYDEGVEAAAALLRRAPLRRPRPTPAT